MTQKRIINLIVLHCSDSFYGSAVLIDKWHKERGWRCIGYHFIILNGYPDEESFRLKRPKFWLDGTIEEGRPPDTPGAHVKGYNQNSIGICLIGKRQFTQRQLLSLAKLLEKLKTDYPAVRLVGHYELIKPGDTPKTCPNIDMEWFRNIGVSKCRSVGGDSTKYEN